MTGNNSAGSGWFSILETQIWSPRNEPPSFQASVLYKADAIEGRPYSGTLAGDAGDPEGGELTFSKDAGPDWLKVSPDGTLSGIPQDSNVGANVFAVRVVDPAGFYDTADMTIQVANIYSGVRGMEDLYGLAAQWLMLDCGDIPACQGADLNGDRNVDMSDVSVLANRWLSDEALQLHLKLDDGNGTTARDSSLYQRSGLLINGPVWTSGVTGGALSLDGTDDYVMIADYRGVPGAGSRTCTAWVKTSVSGLDQIITSWGSAQTGRKWMFRIQPTGEPAVGVWGGFAKGTVSVADNQWHHIAAVLNRDETPTVDEIQFYVDGQLQVTAANNTQPINTSDSEQVYLGVLDTGTLQNYFRGLLDDVRIYSRALTAEEIAALAE
jgi:hypothetical protein